jgi:acyl-homoserine-lactone acylase
LGVTSVPTSLAVFWGDEASGGTWPRMQRGRASPPRSTSNKPPPEQLLQSLARPSDKLAADFGTGRRRGATSIAFQRLTGDIVQPFTDAGPSIPVGFTSSLWGSLASFGARAYPGTKKWYGTSGNSFVAVVEFGETVRAKAVTAGGESGDPASPHFNDQALRYSTGNLRDVYFYRSELQGHTEREYHP